MHFFYRTPVLVRPSCYRTKPYQAIFLLHVAISLPTSPICHDTTMEPPPKPGKTGPLNPGNSALKAVS